MTTTDNSTIQVETSTEPLVLNTPAPPVAPATQNSSNTGLWILGAAAAALFIAYLAVGTPQSTTISNVAAFPSTTQDAGTTTTTEIAPATDTNTVAPVETTPPLVIETKPVKATQEEFNREVEQTTQQQ